MTQGTSIHTSIHTSSHTSILRAQGRGHVVHARPSRDPRSHTRHPPHPQVEGTSYTPVGSVVGLPKVLSAGVLELAKVCALCNQAVIRYVDGKYERVGEPTEAALKVLVEKIGLPGKAKPTDPSLMCKQARAAAPLT